VCLATAETFTENRMCQIAQHSISMTLPLFSQMVNRSVFEHIVVIHGTEIRSYDLLYLRQQLTFLQNQSLAATYPKLIVSRRILCLRQEYIVTVPADSLRIEY